MPIAAVFLNGGTLTSAQMAPMAAIRLLTVFAGAMTLAATGHPHLHCRAYPGTSCQADPLVAAGRNLLGIRLSVAHCSIGVFSSAAMVINIFQQKLPLLSLVKAQSVKQPLLKEVT